MNKPFVVFCLFCASVTSSRLQADVISGSYEIGGNVFVEGISDLPFSGTFNNGDLISHSLVAPPPTNPADVSFNLTGTVLTLRLDAFLPTGLASMLDWDFTSLTLPGVDTLIGVTSGVGTGGAATVNAVTANSISITTPIETSAGSFTYVFNVVDSSTPAPVPEPSSFALLMLGGFGYWGIRRRRQQSATAPA